MRLTVATLAVFMGACLAWASPIQIRANFDDGTLGDLDAKVSVSSSTMTDAKIVVTNNSNGLPDADKELYVQYIYGAAADKAVIDTQNVFGDVIVSGVVGLYNTAYNGGGAGVVAGMPAAGGGGYLLYITNNFADGSGRFWDSALGSSNHWQLVLARKVVGSAYPLSAGNAVSRVKLSAFLENQPNFLRLTVNGTSVTGEAWVGQASAVGIPSATVSLADTSPLTGYTGVYLAGRNLSIPPEKSSFGAVAVDDFKARSLLDSPPTAVTDLTATPTDWSSLRITWCAPSDDLGINGVVSGYELRCSTGPINDGNWASAAVLPSVPVPAAPGTLQTYSLGGLQPNTTLYFALKSFDEEGDASALSNVAVGTTLSADLVPPAGVANLSATNIIPTQLVLHWTASGDDGMAGLATRYDVRYSTSPIGDVSFASATPVTQNLTPKAPGQAESLTVTGLTQQTTYWFAVKVGDEAGNWSALSNVVQVTTPALDFTPPAAITDLAATSEDTANVHLTWTAPVDNVGAASYEIRYSTTTIDETNWSAATAVSNVPIPQAAGAPEQFTVSDLQPMTTYYFAIKSMDGSGNVSSLSNIASRTTAQAPAITTVTIVEKAGVTTANYPVTLSLGLRQGDAFANLTAVIAGQPVATQTDVKVRYDDGSIRHALVSLLIPSLPANGQVVLMVYSGGLNANNAPLSRDVLLGQDFDAVMRITVGGTTTNVSARQMLQAAGDPETWIKGNICTEFLLKDFSANVANQLNVQYRVRIYQGWAGYRVDAVVENCWTQYRGNLTYDISLALGQANPVTVLSKTGFTHNYCARWHKVFWQTSQPGEIQVKYDMPYLISTGLMPRYDLSLVVPESTLAQEYSKWSISNHDLMGPGIITTSFGTTGGRQEIGLLPTWAVRYLLSWDNRQKEIMLNCADVSGHIPIHFRESDPARLFYGRIMSIDDRPTIWNDWWDFSGTTAADRMPAPVGSTSTAWSVDMAHQASFAYVPYLLTGDYYYLEEMVFWAGYNLSWGNAGYRQFSMGLLHEQTRGEGWGIRNIAHAAILMPDGQPEKAYFLEKIANNLTYWTNKYVPSNNYPTIRYWQTGSTVVRPDPSLDPNCLYYTLPWQDDFVLLVMSHLKSLGFDTKALMNWLGASVIGRFTSPGFNPYRGVDYRIPVQYNDGNGNGIPYATWHDIDQAYADTPPNNFSNYEYSDSYAYIARAALACCGSLVNGSPTWHWLDDHLHSQSGLNADPTWAIMPGPAIAGDANGDGRVNVGDLQLLVASWAKAPQDIGYNPNADFNGDGRVNVGDLQLLIASWGQSL